MLFAPRLLLTLLMFFLLANAQAGDLMTGIKSRGELRCGVSEGIAGFSKKDADGRWQGMDADFCRAVATALFGDPEKASFLPLKSSIRFPALQSGRIDLLVRNTSWTMAREVSFGVQFPGVLFYDGQGFMVAYSANVAAASDLQGATICVEKGTTHLENLTEYALAKDLKVTPLVLDSASEVSAAFFAGRCQAYTSDASQLAAVRLDAPPEAGGPEAFMVLPDRISKEPLAPVVLDKDPQWTSLVRWVLYVLILAEEQGITRDNVAVKWAELKERRLRAWKLAGGNEINFGQLMGASNEWGMKVIAAVGNYGEIYERNVGRDSPLKIDRGLNRLWSDGGLMYAPPVD